MRMRLAIYTCSSFKRTMTAAGYSIRCGLDAVEFRANSRSEAQEMAYRRIFGAEGNDELGYDEEHKIASAKLFKVSDSIDVPVQDMYAERAAERAAHRASLEKQARLAEYERLKKEFDGRMSDEHPACVNRG